MRDGIETKLRTDFWIPLVSTVITERDLFVSTEKNYRNISDLIQSISNTVLKDLFEQYDQIHRSYHDTSHIYYMLENHKKYHKMVHINDKEAVEFAIFFHDYIYTTVEKHYKNNEILSAEAARYILKNILCLDSDFVNKVVLLIRSTAYESDVLDEIKDDNDLLDINYLHDLDFLYFSDSYLDFVKKTKCIKKEFPLRTRLKFDDLRKEFLWRLLEYKIKGYNLFKTSFFIDQFEAKAFNNIIRYLKEH